MQKEDLILLTLAHSKKTFWMGPQRTKAGSIAVPVWIRGADGWKPALGFTIYHDPNQLELIRVAYGKNTIAGPWKMERQSGIEGVKAFMKVDLFAGEDGNHIEHCLPAEIAVLHFKPLAGESVISLAGGRWNAYDYKWADFVVKP